MAGAAAVKRTTFLANHQAGKGAAYSRLALSRHFLIPLNDLLRFPERLLINDGLVRPFGEIAGHLSAVDRFSLIQVIVPVALLRQDTGYDTIQFFFPFSKVGA